MPFFGCRDTSRAKQLCLGRTPPRAPQLAPGRAGNTARSAEAPQFESRRRPGPQRPPASRPIGLTSAPAAQLTAPLRRAALTRPHARRGRGAAGIRAARFRPRFRFLAPPGLGRHGLLPAPASRPAPAAALPAPRCPRLDPAFIWLTAPFSFAPPESQNNRSRAGAGRKRKAGRAGAARGDVGVCVGASRAAAGQPGRVRGAGSRGRGGHPASGVTWKKQFPEFSSAPLGLLCSSSCSSLRCLPEIQTLAGLARVGASITPRDVEVRGGGHWTVRRMGCFLSSSLQRLRTFSLLRPRKYRHHGDNPQFGSKWVQRTVSTSDASSQYLLQCSRHPPCPKFQSKALKQQVLVV